MRVCTILGTSALRLPDKIAVRQAGRSLTFADVWTRGYRFAAYLKAAGIGPGERVALLCTNTVELFELQLGCQLADVILTPLNFRLATPELAWIIKDCAPALLIHTADLATTAQALAVRRIAIGHEYEAALPDVEVDPSIVSTVDAQQPATIMYTSGTTGRPKGVLITHEQLHARLLTNDITVGLREDAVVAQPMPFYHVGSHMAYAFAYRGATNVLQSTFDAADLVDAIATAGVTTAHLVPTMIERLCDHVEESGIDLRGRLQHIVYGGAPMPPGRVARALRLLGCRMSQMYGMTEAGGVCALHPHEHGVADLAASAGRANSYVDIRIEYAHGDPCPTGAIGRVCVRSPSVMAGYWNQPQLTADTLVDGWLCSADLGYLDHRGYLYLTDRVDDMIVTGGENVYPSEVERVLRAHPDVRAAVVVGVPDSEFGQRVGALVVLTPNADGDPVRLVEHCRVQLGGFKVPRLVQVVDELPVNATGKVSRQQARDRLQEAT